MATPPEFGDAEPTVTSALSVEDEVNDIATPEHPGDAKGDFGLPRTPEVQPDVMATPEVAGNANSEQQSKVELMVENAKLTAQLDSQEDLIGELREDKKFMREQIVHQRGNDTLMADMHRETLHTLKAVSVAGRHTRIEMSDPSAEEKGSAVYDVRDSEHRPQADGISGV